MEHEIIIRSTKLLRQHGLLPSTDDEQHQAIYTTLGLYSNGDYKTNGVKAINIVNHVAYNLQARPGRALFVQGKCIYPGSVSPNEIDTITQMYLDNKLTFSNEDTAPYH